MVKTGTEPEWMPGEFDPALRKRFVNFVALVALGLDAGHIKAKPIQPTFDPNAESLEMTSLDELAAGLLRDCGCLDDAQGEKE